MPDSIVLPPSVRVAPSGAIGGAGGKVFAFFPGGSPTVDFTANPAGWLTVPSSVELTCDRTNNLFDCVAVLTGYDANGFSAHVRSLNGTPPVNEPVFVNWSRD